MCFISTSSTDRQFQFEYLFAYPSYMHKAAIQNLFTQAQVSSSCPYQPELRSGHATSCQKSTINFCPLSHLFQCLSCLGGAQTAYCMICIKIQVDFASLAIYNIILTGLFMNDSLAWWIVYEVLSRVSQCFSFRTGFVSHSLSRCTAAYQVRSANTFLVAWPAQNLLIV